MTPPPPRDLAHYCEWPPERSRRPCYAPAAFVPIRPGGETLRFTMCGARARLGHPGSRPDVVLERDEGEARGGGYRGTMLGG